MPILGVRFALPPGRLRPGRLPALPVEVALHPGPEPAARPAPARGARGDRRRPGAAGQPGGPPALRPAPGYRGHDLAGRPRLRLAPGALPRAGQGGPAKRGRRRGHQPRPPRGMAPRTSARTYAYLALRRARGIAADFANGIRPFTGHRARATADRANAGVVISGNA